MNSVDYPLIIAILSTIFAGVGLFLNWRAVRENNKTRQIELLNETFERIINLESKLYAEYKNKTGSKSKEIKDWANLLLNTVEYFSFLVNEGYIKDKGMVAFFKYPVIRWYEETFLEFYTDKERENKELFKEFRKLYDRLKGTTE